MAESDVQINQSEEVERLQYLEIVHLAVVKAVLSASSLYCYAKENAGPLKNGVENVEGTVKTVVGPVYDRYHAVPFQLLKLADRKVLSVIFPDSISEKLFEVAESIQELERHMPEGLKDACAKAQKAPEVARMVAGEVQRAGVVGTAAGLAKAAYARAEPAAERLATSTWRSLNRLPAFPQVARTVVPVANGLSERYNHAVSCAAEKGYAAAAYLPLVPTERLTKVFAASN